MLLMVAAKCFDCCLVLWVCVFIAGGARWVLVMFFFRFLLLLYVADLDFARPIGRLWLVQPEVQ